MRHRAGERIGAYVVRGTVDESDHACVLEVQHAVLGTHHALKIAVDGADAAVCRSLHRGARLQAMVDHPHVVRCTDAGEHAGLPWLAPDWMNGGSLAQLLDGHGALSVSNALRVFRGVTRGLHALHSVGVVHRDLKPSNVLFLVADGRRSPKITDLALAKCLDHSTDHDAQPTLSQEFRTIGTPEYMAPEQAANPATVDLRADLYSLGVLLYEMLTNEVPHEAEETWRILVAARIGRYRPMRELRPEVPEALEQLVAELLSPERDRRLRSTEVLLERLDRLVPAHGAGTTS
jgi:serine/threonine protein kinase